MTGNHEATGPWQRSPDRSTWVAAYHRARLVVTRLSLDRWQPVVERPGGERERGPVHPTRRQAQAWAERKAGEGGD